MNKLSETTIIRKITTFLMSTVLIFNFFIISVFGDLREPTVSEIKEQIAIEPGKLQQILSISTFLDYKCYNVTEVEHEKTLPTNVTLIDQFGKEIVRILNPFSLCLPTMKEYPMKSHIKEEGIGGGVVASVEDYQRCLEEMRLAYDNCIKLGVKTEEECKKEFEINLKEKCEGLEPIESIEFIGPHYKCYKIAEIKSETRLPINVTISDQFGKEFVQVKKPSLLCTPATKELISYPPFPTPPIQPPLEPIEESTLISEERGGTASNEYEKCLEEIKLLYIECIKTRTEEECRKELETNINAKCEILKVSEVVSTPPTLEGNYDICTKECNERLDDLKKLGVPSENAETYYKICVAKCEEYFPKEMQTREIGWRLAGPHYKCYDIEEKVQQKLINITLVDQFGREIVYVLEPILLCAQAEKEIEKLSVESKRSPLPITGREILSAPVPTSEDEFMKCLEEIKLKYSKCLETKPAEECKKEFELAERECEKFRPSITPAPISTVPKPISAIEKEFIPHYKCYRIREIERNYSLPLVVNVTDQFGKETLNVLEATILCTPAEKQENFTRAVIGPKVLIEGKEVLGEKVRTEVKGEEVEIAAGERINLTHGNITASGQIEIEFREGKIFGAKSKKPIEILPAELEKIPELGLHEIMKIEVEEDDEIVKYKVETTTEGRILWFLPISLRTNYHIDATTGQILKIERPWWSIFVTTINCPVKPEEIPGECFELPGRRGSYGSNGYNVTHYNVSGNFSEACRQIPEAAGKTDYSFLPRTCVKYETKVEKCECVCTATADTTIDFSVTVTLPNWVNYTTGSDKEKEKWDEFIENLRKHEEGHVDIAKKYKEKMDKDLDLSESATAKKCKDACSKALKKLNKKINEKLEEIFNEHENEQEQYDKDTDHGAKQGTTIDCEDP